MKKNKKIILTVFLSVSYFLLDAQLPKLKTDKLDLTNWNYSKIKDLKSKRTKADSLYLIKDYVGSESIVKSISPTNDYELKDLLNLCKIYSLTERKDSLIKYFHLYITLRNKNPGLLLDLRNSIKIDSMIEFKNYLNDSMFISLKSKLFNDIKTKEKEFDTLLIHQLEAMLADVQDSRTEKEAINKDRINHIKLDSIIKAKGIPKLSTVGFMGTVSLFVIIQHSDDVYMEKYFSSLEKLSLEGEFPNDFFGYIIDRRNMYKGIPQVFGTQLCMSSVITKKMKIWPIADENNVDYRRYTLGLGPLKEYKKQFGL
jgi:hypothetical protein